MRVAIAATDERVTVDVSDDGVGGADAAAGSGLRGLADRVEALGAHSRSTARPAASTSCSPRWRDDRLPALTWHSEQASASSAGAPRQFCELAFWARLPPQEVALYFVVSKALAPPQVRDDLGAARRAGATAERRCVSGDGVGGALGRPGGGLRGLLDRVDALDGHITVDSLPGHGTTVHAWVPLPPDERPRGHARHEFAGLAGRLRTTALSPDIPKYSAIAPGRHELAGRRRSRPVGSGSGAWPVCTLHGLAGAVELDQVVDPQAFATAFWRLEALMSCVGPAPEAAREPSVAMSAASRRVAAAD